MLLQVKTIMRLLKLNSDKYVWVNHQKYEVDWDKKVGSNFQFDVKQFFRRYWEHNIVCEEFTIPGSRLRCDLINFNKNIIVEADGIQHDKFNPHFHANSRFKYWKQIQRDVQKREWAEKNEFLFIQIFPNDMPLTRAFILDKYNLQLG